MNYESQVPRKVVLLFGALLTIVGLPFLLLGIYGMAKSSWDGNENELLLIFILAVLVGAFCVRTGIRMMGGWRRKDGGLLSPTALRIGGFLFAIGPLIMILEAGEINWRSVLWLLEFGFYLAAAVTCFSIASKRQHVSLNQKSLESDA